MGIVNLTRIHHTFRTSLVSVGGTGQIVFTASEHQALRDYCGIVSDLIEIVRSISQQWEQRLDQIHASTVTSAYLTSTIRSGARGRPRFDVSRNQLEYLSSLSFTWTEAASLLGVSRMTIYRRRREFGMLGLVVILVMWNCGHN